MKVVMLVTTPIGSIVFAKYTKYIMRGMNAHVKKASSLNPE